LRINKNVCVPLRSINSLWVTSAAQGVKIIFVIAGIQLNRYGGRAFTPGLTRITALFFPPPCNVESHSLGPHNRCSIHNRSMNVTRPPPPTFGKNVGPVQLCAQTQGCGDCTRRRLRPQRSFAHSWCEQHRVIEQRLGESRAGEDVLRAVIRENYMNMRI
jgi:hypothetical protein